MTPPVGPHARWQIGWATSRSRSAIRPRDRVGASPRALRVWRRQGARHRALPAGCLFPASPGGALAALACSSLGSCCRARSRPLRRVRAADAAGALGIPLTVGALVCTRFRSVEGQLASLLATPRALINLALLIQFASSLRSPTPMVGTLRPACRSAPFPTTSGRTAASVTQGLVRVLRAQRIDGGGPRAVGPSPLVDALHGHRRLRVDGCALHG